MLAHLVRSRVCVLAAPPGAGKTTLVPLALLDAPWRFDRRVVMAEPRRVAARMAARRMAALRAEPVGFTIGYRTRDDTKISANTRVEVVTDGVLTRMLQTDLGVERVAAVILDEFHERHLETDLALALLIETMQALRDDLRLIVMSATLDTGPLVTCLERALHRPVGVVVAKGRTHAVTVSHAPPPPGTPPDRAVVDAIMATRTETSGGDILAFLPGAPEIRRAIRVLDRHRSALGDDVVLALHGSLSAGEQDAVVRPSSGPRRIVLATAVAQTSVTIVGVTTVIDSGWARHARFDARSGLTRLLTQRVTQATADQRAGRAGRERPGQCVRLWSPREQLIEHDQPDILTGDLTGLALQLARWGTTNTRELTFLDPPDQSAMQAARTLLTSLGAVDPHGQITDHGKAMADLPTDARIAHLLLRGAVLGAPTMAARLAAILQEGDPQRGEGADLRRRLALVAGDPRRSSASEGGTSGGTSVVDAAVLRRVRQTASRFERLLSAAPGSRVTAQPSVGGLLAVAYPDRLAALDGTAYRFGSGAMARLAADDPLTGTRTLVVADIDGDRKDGRIWLAAPIGAEEIAEFYPITISSRVEPVPDSTRLRAFEQRAVDGLIVDRRPVVDEAAISTVARRDATLALFERDGLEAAIGGEGRAEPVLERRARLRFAQSLDPMGHWPDPSDSAIAAALSQWVKSPTLSRPFGPQPAAALLTFLDDHRLDRFAPLDIELGGSIRRIDYGDGTERPRVRVRLQRVLAVSVHPRIGLGKAPLVVELLSPADRTIATTADLPGFWRTGYAAVRKELRGRYPKHAWPEHPDQPPT